MRKKIFFRLIEYFMLIPAILMLLGVCGCTGEDSVSSNRTFNHSMDESNELADNSENDKANMKEDYLIVSINSADETMRVYRYANGLEYQYYYGLTTRFLNKYGDYTSIANFKEGDVINISETDLSGRVTEVRKSSDVWVYDDVVRFSINDDEGVLDIAGTNYKIDDETYVFSGGRQASLTEVTEQDKLSVVGIDKKILSISVTTGHGILQLANTELFEGSYLQLNRNIFVMITENMVMNLPEGAYTLVVANNGWGGSKEIEIKRDETMLVNLDEIKGEGPSYGEILFKVDVEEAQIYIDNELVDITAPVSLTYGAHSFEIVAEGYEKWKKTLYVNSPEATIELTLEEADKNSSDSSSNNADSSNNNSSDNNSSDNNSSDNNGSDNDSTNKSDSGNSQNSGNSENSGNGQNNKNDKSDKSEIEDMLDSIKSDNLKDYLSTLSTLLDSL